MKKRITEKDYIKANRRASRAEEIALHGRPVGRGRVHASKKIYNRKKLKAGLKDLPYLFSTKNLSADILQSPLCGCKG